MRTRTGWLALLLTAGVALSPTAGRAQAPEGAGSVPDPRLTAALLPPYIARGQLGSPTLDYDVPRADPVYPLPLYHDRPDTGGFFAAAEFNFWRQTNPLRHQVIAVRGLVDVDGSIHQDMPVGQAYQSLGRTLINSGLVQQVNIGTILDFNLIFLPNGTFILQPIPVQLTADVTIGDPLPGGFIGSGRAALHADDVAGPSTYVPGWTVTLGYRFREGFAAEVSWTHLFNARYVGGATLMPQGLQLGAILEDSFLFSPVYNFPTAYAGPANKVALGNPMAAYGIWNGATEMSLRFDQRYDEWNIGARVPIVETEGCRCYGLAGMRHVWMWERFTWRTVAYDFAGLADASDAAVYSNVVSNPMYGGYIGCGSEAYLGHGFSVSLDVKAALMVDFARMNVKWERGDLATEAKRSIRNYSVVPELDANLSLWWYPIEGIELRIGYDVKNFFNTLASPNPVSFNFAGLDPVFEHKAWRLVDGWRAGIAFIF